MQGYQAVLNAAKADQPLSDVHLFIDTVPLRYENGVPVRKLTAGHLLIDPTDDPAKLAFNALRGSRVHISGGNSERVKAFAEHVWAFKPSVLCWDDGEQMELWRA